MIKLSVDKAKLAATKQKLAAAAKATGAAAGTATKSTREVAGMYGSWLGSVPRPTISWKR